MPSVDETIALDVLLIMKLLAKREYEAVSRIAGNARWTAVEIAAAVEAYGGTLTTPPDGDLTGVAAEVTEDIFRRIHLTVPFWTTEEGESRLVLEMDITEDRNGIWNDEICEIYVR